MSRVEPRSEGETEHVAAAPETIRFAVVTILAIAFVQGLTVGLLAVLIAVLQ